VAVFCGVLMFLFHVDIIAGGEPIVMFRGLRQSGCHWIL